MSHVDNALLAFSILEREGERMARVNEWCLAACGQQFVDIDAEGHRGWYGGRKFFEAPLWVAAFNYFPEDEFMEFLPSAGWEYPGEVQYIVRRQHDDVFVILTLAGVSKDAAGVDLP